MRSFTPAAGTVTVFTTPWCGYCRMLKLGLDRGGVAYREVNIEKDPEAVVIVAHANGGNQTVPTVLFADGSTATNPSASDVRARLGWLRAGLAQGWADSGRRVDRLAEPVLDEAQRDRDP